MPREYTVKSWKPWENDQGLIRDPHGNYKGTVTFEEDNAEPIDASFKSQPNVGDKKYGTVGEYTTKSGNVRRGFKSAPKPKDGQSFGSSSSGYKDNSDGMRQGMCFNNATLFVNMMLADEKPKPTPEEWAELVFAHAQALYLKGDLKTEQKPEAPVDKVFQVKEEQPINLDDIPF